MQSIEDKIKHSLKKCGRGTVFSTMRFAHYGTTRAVQKAIERLAIDGTVIRVARGIYCYPKIDTELGLGIIYPSFDDIAQAIAKRDKAQIVPAGAYAANKLGLSTQVPLNVIFLTSGESRKVEIRNGRGIHFKHAAPKNFAFESSFAQLLAVALKEIGKDNITAEQHSTLGLLLQEQPRISDMDLKLMPIWTKKLLNELYHEQQLPLTSNRTEKDNTGHC